MGGRRILKAEILITRKCNLNCSYCKIKRKDSPEMGIELWRRGIDNLKELGCAFCPIYGAEPLVVFDLLKGFLSYCREVEMSSSVITNATLLTEDKMDELVESGMDSITVSVDSLQGNYSDAYTRLRALRSLDVLNYLDGKIRDIEVSITVTKKNLLEIPDMIKMFSGKGWWTSLDLVHYDKGHIGTKVAFREQMKGLVFSGEDGRIVSEMGEKLARMKESGRYLIHQSSSYFRLWGKYGVGQNWKCSYPAWVSVDCDGSMLVCDDYEGEEVKKIKVYELSDKWEEFLKIWKREVKGCNGCFWSTHYMSQEMLEFPLAGEYFRHGILPKNFER